MQLNDIKIYQDAYADKEFVLCGFKGKRFDKHGVFYCPYVKPNKPKLSLINVKHCTLQTCMTQKVDNCKSIQMMNGNIT